MPSIITVSDLSKIYADGFQALHQIDLDIKEGEILALLGPNGAGKTTLIGSICGLVRVPPGHIRVGGHDIVTNYRAARELIGLVPQELTTDAFESVWATVSFSRGLFGRSPDPALIERILRDLSLWDKRDNRIMTLSGGMKRRVMIAKALSHEPRILFLDEPTAGVDVSLRKDMWQMVRRLRESGVTIVLTTHYIEEAQEMADRIGVINRGRLLLIEEKAALMRQLGSRQLVVRLREPLSRIPDALADHDLVLAPDGLELTYRYGTDEGRGAGRGATGGMVGVLDALRRAGLEITDLNTSETSLEDIFVSLVEGGAKV